MAKNINKTKNQKRMRDSLIDKSYSYLLVNFHKFTQTNKIKIALELIKKDMGDNVKHSGSMLFEGNLLAGHISKFGEHAEEIDKKLDGSMS